MKHSLVVVMLGLLPLSVLAQAPDQAQACAACHGQTGVSTHPAFVKPLSDNDIAVLAMYYAEQPTAIAIKGDSSLVEKGKNLSAVCTPCHGNQGSPVANEWPKLSGQHAAYLKNQLNLFKSGARISSHMRAALASLNLGDADFAALAAYYNQLQAKRAPNQNR